MGGQDVAIMERSGTKLVISAAEPSKVLVLAGEPIDEPIAARGPFVMNTMDEIIQANEDYHSGRF
jgi:redox-sensitive bicupin YhaK (pirin superfamily)